MLPGLMRHVLLGRLAQETSGSFSLLGRSPTKRWARLDSTCRCSSLIPRHALPLEISGAKHPIGRYCPVPLCTDCPPIDARPSLQRRLCLSSKDLATMVEETVFRPERNSIKQTPACPSCYAELPGVRSHPGRSFEQLLAAFIATRSKMGLEQRARRVSE